MVSFNNPKRKAKPGSIGLPIWGVEMKPLTRTSTPLKAGRERSPCAHCVMKGYHNRPEANAQVMRDGWFGTGDIARRDEEGFYFIIDRSKDMIIRGGYNEKFAGDRRGADDAPQVSLAAVVGVPHDTHGEEIKAFVIPAGGHPHRTN